MKSYNTLYYLLIVLLIMGAFASMAQNSYGFKILAVVSIAFGVIFLFQFIDKLRRKDYKDKNTLIELFALFLLSSILALRIFNIHFPFIEWVFASTGIILILLYTERMVYRFRLFQPKQRFLSILILFFYLSILLFIVAMVTISFLPRLSEFAGSSAFILLILFVVAGLLKRKFLVNGESISALKVITRFKDKSVLLLSLFFIFSLYLGFTRTGILPKLYSDEFPQAYFELVNKAETGNEQLVNGRYKHEVFKAMYDEFLDRNIKKDPKSGRVP